VPKNDRKAVILLSGGVDSSTALALSLKNGYQVNPISFEYGQRHSRENESSRKIAEHYGLKLKEFSIDLRQIGGSSLTSEAAVEDHSPDEIGSTIPNTYVPSRNIIFLSIAASYAETIGARTIIYGANSVDYSGYPDCRPSFVNYMERALQEGTKIGTEEGMSVVAPLQYLSKGEIIRMGLKLGVPYKLTWSCYRGGEKACGRCDSCILRLKGFMEAGSPDPIEYESLPEFYQTFLNNL